MLLSKADDRRTIKWSDNIGRFYRTTKIGRFLYGTRPILSFVCHRLYIAYHVQSYTRQNGIIEPWQRMTHCQVPSASFIRTRRSRSAAAYSDQSFPWTICRSVRASVRASFCPMHCGKTADRIRMPFGIIGRTVPGMRQVVGFGDRSTRRGYFLGRIWGAPL